METNGYHFIPLNVGERFDSVDVRTVERWKESELSGDEWRYSYVAYFFSHGVLVAETRGRSIEDVLKVASVDYNRVTNGTDGGYYGDLANLCCQPGCKNVWVHLLHPLKRYTKQGQELMRLYSEKDVRGFCEKHKHRGDCGLDDADVNYVGVAYRDVSGKWMPPDPSVGRRD